MTQISEADQGSAPAAPARLPWKAPDLFPLKPDGPEYGYWLRGEPVPCTREELDKTVRRIDVPAGLVWTPQNSRLTPAEEVPELFAAVRDRETRDARYSFNTALIHIVVWSALFVLYYAFARHESPMIFVILLLAFGIVPAMQATTARKRLAQASDADMSRTAIAVRYGAWLINRRIIATWVLGGLLTLVLLTQLWTEGSLLNMFQRSIDAAGLKKSIVLQNTEMWRLLTSMMLHGHLLHFGLNFLALLTVGRLMEVHAHPAYLSIVFLFSAICGSVASLYLAPTGPPSIGASGGLMGMIGFLLVMGYRRKEVLPPGFLKAILLSIGFIVAIGLIAARMIDNAAHLGGLAGGIALGQIYVTRRSDNKFRLEPSPLSLAAGVLCMAILAGIAGFAAWKITMFKG